MGFDWLELSATPPLQLYVEPARLSQNNAYLPANVMRHAGNPPATGLHLAVAYIVSAGVASA